MARERGTPPSKSTPVAPRPVTRPRTWEENAAGLVVAGLGLLLVGLLATRVSKGSAEPTTDVAPQAALAATAPASLETSGGTQAWDTDIDLADVVGTYLFGREELGSGPTVHAWRPEQGLILAQQEVARVQAALREAVLVDQGHVSGAPCQQAQTSRQRVGPPAEVETASVWDVVQNQVDRRLSVWPRPLMVNGVGQDVNTLAGARSPAPKGSRKAVWRRLHQRDLGSPYPFPTANVELAGLQPRLAEPCVSACAESCSSCSR